MADWPITAFTPTHSFVNTTTSHASLLSDFVTVSASGVTAAAVWPAANRAYYMPFIVEQAVTAYQILFEVGIQSGNYDAGIYDEYGVRLASTGSTAVPVAGKVTANIADTILTPGLYYVALCIDNITATVIRVTPALQLVTLLGMRQQALGAVTLPNPATFASPTGTGYIPSVSVFFTATA